jgi:glycosyltransferase involved in cell wall biosynthesis
MEKTRILMVIAFFYPYTGGAERQAQKLACELIERNIDVKVVTGRWDNNLKKIEKIGGLNIIRNFTNFDFWKKEKVNTDKGFFYSEPLDKKSILKSLKIIFRKIFVRLSVYIYQLSLFLFLLFYRKNYDIIHVHQVLYPAFISTLCARILKKPVIAKVGNSGFNSDINQIKEFPEGKLQLKFILRNINKIICTTKIMKEEFLNEGVEEKKLVMIRNGVKIENIYRLYESCNNFIYAGRFISNKNLHTLISAFSEVVHSANRRLELFLIGDGPEKDNIIALIKKFKLNGNINLAGMVDSIDKFLRESDLFILPSFVEGLSNSLIEAMSYRLPCIVSNIPGNVEVIGDVGKDYNIGKGDFEITECGVLFNPYDKEGLVNAIKYLLENPDIRKKIGENAYNRMKNEYNIEVIADRYVDLYKEVLEQ